MRPDVNASYGAALHREPERGDVPAEQPPPEIRTSALEQVWDIPIVNLTPDPFQPRKEFHENSIRELADSIAQHGLLQPLLVRPMQGPNSRGKYWIVAGERRYRAAQKLLMETLPCRVRPFENTTAAVAALAENVHRENLSEIEKAEALQRIKLLTEKTWEEVAELVKLSRDYVKRLVGLLKLADPVKELVRSGEISARVAIALRPLSTRQQIEMAERVIREGLTAEQIREETRKGARGRQAPASSAPDFRLPDEVAEPGGATLERAGAVVKALRECSEAVEKMDSWLEGRDWSPSKVTSKQKDGIADLNRAVVLLQQSLLGIRNRLRDAEAPEAEKLRNAELFPF
jgi:ParB family chromosome partitioning protein